MPEARATDNYVNRIIGERQPIGVLQNHIHTLGIRKVNADILQMRWAHLPQRAIHVLRTYINNKYHCLFFAA